jgi:hypothetical protein
LPMAAEDERTQIARDLWLAKSKFQVAPSAIS